ncbi:alpha/beta hydrolase [Streptomyces sp. NBC_01571]|nr:alpha/beta hydrolase [Streptomyces sp. NBC_01571]
MRWYAKTGAAAGSAVLFFHGGGYIFVHIDLFDGPESRYLRQWRADAVGRMPPGPEHPFPTPVEAAYAALCWLHEHAGELGVDRDRIAVMGDSAGGGLATALPIFTRERGSPAIARQILLMPMLDDRTNKPDPHIEPYLLWSCDDSRTAWPALGDVARCRGPALNTRAFGRSGPTRASPAVWPTGPLRSLGANWRSCARNRISVAFRSNRNGGR